MRPYPGTVLRVLLTVSLVYLGFVALCTAFVGGMLYALRRRNRVSATVKSPAPTTWLVSPAAPARMHRRLRNACTSARVAYAPTVGEAHPQLPELAQTLEGEAIVLDRLLVEASVTPRPHRRRTLLPLRAQVREIERLAQEIAVTARRAGPGALPQASDGLREIRDQLAARQAAQAEVEAVERVAQGHIDLTAAGPVPAPVAPPPSVGAPGPVPPATPGATAPPSTPPVQII